MAFLLTATGATPADGAEVVEVLTEDLNKVLAASLTLTTSAVVANRTVTLVLDDGTDILWRKESPVVQAASLARTYLFLTAIPDDAGFDGSGTIRLALPPNLALATGSRLRTITTNLDVDDAYAAPLLHMAQATERDDIGFSL